jgi:hypothetical protein
MKKILTLLICVVTLSNTIAQTKNTINCGTDDLHIQLLKENLDYKAKFDKNNALWQEWAPKNTNVRNLKGNTVEGKLNATSRTTNAVVLQVVFHNMHCPANDPSLTNNPGIPMTYPDYTAIIDKLNAIYAGSALPPYIPSTINDSGIQFCLAKQDILGNAYTSTQTQHLTTLSTIDRQDIEQIKQIANDSGSLLTFPRTRYINIYIVDDILSGSGFAFLPSAHGLNVDGIYLERQLFNGADEAELNAKITTLAHEMGHYLGLFHTFGICNPDILGNLPTTDPYFNFCSCDNDNCLQNGDMVCDTPPSMLVQNLLNCSTPSNTCSTDAVSLIINGIQQNPFTGAVISNADDDKSNYMDYTPYACRNHFTQGQINRMQFILDPTYGARKSLLGGNSTCADCGTMTGYQPLIQGVPTIATTVNESANLSFNASFENNSGPFTTAPVTYSWTLQLLDGTPLQAPTQSNANPFNAGSLVAGNYSITVNAIINANCFKTTTSYFSITPNSTNCNLQLPTSNSFWSNWERVYYENGWSRSGTTATSPFTNASTTRTIIPNNSSNIVDNGFDIIDLSQLASTDSNFNIASITSPTTNPAPPTNIKLMRVGKIITATADLKDGAAYYANYTFNPTKENCKYRVWYLGISNVGLAATTIAYQNFNVTQQTSTTFGFLSRYKLNTTAIIGNSPNPPVTYLGMNENGYLVGAPNAFSNSVKSKQFGLNDMVFGRFHSVLTSNTSNIEQININYTPYIRTKKWQYYDIDFSEFVDTPGYVLGTDITLTFFACTNDAIPAISHSYAYFGIECKGGGLPADLTMDFPNVQLPCQQGSKSYLNTIYLPRPKYALERKPDNGNSYFSWLNPSDSFNGNYANLATIKVESSTNSNGGFTPLVVGDYLKNVSTDDRYSENYLYLTNENPPNTSLFYRVTLKTLHKTLVSLFKVTNGNRITASPPCIERLGVIAAGNETINFNTNQTLELNYQSLTNCDANHTPLQETPYYIWKKYTCTDATCTTFTEPTVITDATGPSLTINTSDYQNCRTYIARYTSFEYPYCGNQFYKASVFTLNNTAAFAASSYTASKTDICITGSFNLTISNFKLTLPNCPIPAPYGQNSVKLQLAKTNNNLNLLGSAEVINFNATLNNPVPIFDLSFANQIFPGNYQFPSNGTFTIYLRIEYNLFGSAPVIEYKPISFNISNSPVPGALGAVTATCTTFSIANSNLTTTSFNDQWGWQYSSAIDGVYNDMPNTTSPSLLNYQFSQIPISPTVPFFIRRVSFGGIGSCANPTYTVAIPVTNIPNFATSIIYCSSSANLPLSIVAPNGVKGSWSPAFIPTIPSSDTTATQLTTNYTFTVEGSCGIEQVVSVQLVRPTKPTAATPQNLCAGARISDLVAQTTITGATIRWTLTGGGSQSFINPNTFLTSSTYFVGQSLPVNEASCIGLKQAVVVTITTPVPPTANAQTFCDGATVASLVATGTGIKWYNALTGGTALTSTTTLNSGNYFASQTVGVCESTRTAVAVTVNPSITPTFLPVSAICSGETLAALPTTSNNANNAIAGTWLPALNNTTTTLYTFTPTAGQCANNAIMTITVNPNTLIAVNDTFTLLSGTTTSVLANDTVNAVSVTLVPVGAVPTFTSGGITLNANGTLTILPYTTMGTYTFPYKLQSSCGASNTATITITVPLSTINISISPKIWIPSFCYSATAQTSTASIFDVSQGGGLGGATIDGVPCNASNVTITNVNFEHITLNPDGTGTVAGGTLPFFVSDYTVEICPKATPGFNCKTAYLECWLIGAGGVFTNIPQIRTLIDGSLCTNVYNSTNIFDNDFVYNCYDGSYTQAGLNNTTLTVLGSSDYIFINQATGEITRPNYPLSFGTYTLPYQLCYSSLNGAPADCRMKFVELKVVSNCTDFTQKTTDYGEKTPDILFNQEVVLYPNPTDGLCYIKLDNPLKQEINVEVFTMIGQKVLTTKASTNEITLDLANYPKVTYLIKIAKGENISYKKIIKN